LDEADKLFYSFVSDALYESFAEPLPRFVSEVAAIAWKAVTAPASADSFLQTAFALVAVIVASSTPAPNAPLLHMLAYTADQSTVRNRVSQFFDNHLNSLANSITVALGSGSVMLGSISHVKAIPALSFGL